MTSKELRDYIRKNLKNYSFDMIKGNLMATGFAEKEIDHAFKKITHPAGAFKIFSMFFLCLLLFGSMYAYFFVISPVFVQKPILEKTPLNINAPALSSLPSPVNQTLIKSGHIIFLLNEIGAYKLHPSLTGENPQINVDVDGRGYSFSVINNGIIDVQNNLNPDIKIISNESSLIMIYQSNNTKNAVLTEYNNGSIKIVPIAEMSVLALKGYKSLYDYFGITGSVISNKNVEEYYSIIDLIFIAIVSGIIIALAYLAKKELV